MFFTELDKETRDLALILIMIHNGIGMFLWPLSFVFPNVLRSMNDVRWPMCISIASMIIVRIGISYAIEKPLGSGVLAVWIAMVFDWLVRIACFLLRYRSGAWIRLSHCKERAAQARESSAFFAPCARTAEESRPEQAPVDLVSDARPHFLPEEQKKKSAVEDPDQGP